MQKSSVNLQVVYRDVASLRPQARNARKHSKAQLRKLRRSMDEFGWTNPVLIDEAGDVLCGHGRLEVAIARGDKVVPTIQLSHMSEAQKRAYILADNRIAEQASWSRALLRTELQGLIEIGYDVELSGFDTIEIDTVLSIGEPETTRDDEIPQLDAVPAVCRLGDFWHIGPHRLLIGDARDPACYDRLLDGEVAQLVFIDPPYGCRIKNNVSGNGRVRHDDFVMGASGKLDADFVAGLLRPALRCIKSHASPGAICFACIDWRGGPFLLDAASGVFAEVKNLVVWAKTNAGLGSFYRSAHELIYVLKINPGTHINNFGLGEGGRNRSNVWTYAGANSFHAGREQDLADHPTVKPKQLVADALLDCSKRDGIVLDSFAGSGTTLVAAAMTGRRGYGMELDPRYGDVILRRVAQETGCTPLLDGKRPLAEVASARSSEAGDAA